MTYKEALNALSIRALVVICYSTHLQASWYENANFIAQRSANAWENVSATVATFLCRARVCLHFVVQTKQKYFVMLEKTWKLLMKISSFLGNYRLKTPEVVSFAGKFFDVWWNLSKPPSLHHREPPRAFSFLFTFCTRKRGTSTLRWLTRTCAMALKFPLELLKLVAPKKNVDQFSLILWTDLLCFFRVETSRKVLIKIDLCAKKETTWV